MTQTVAQIANILAAAYPPEEAQELAFWLLEELTGKSRADISACKDTQNISNIEIFLTRLLKKEPIQYIFGHTSWYGLDLLVTKDTLIPRPETAELVDLVLQTLPNDSAKTFSVLDIGTGSGCIALKIKEKRHHWQVTGLDISLAALDVARKNAIRNNIDVHFIQVDILTNPDLKYDCIISNPPYITESEKTTMEANVLDYEPPTALFVPDNDPLRFYRAITNLHANWLFFEVNSLFAADVAQLMTENGYSKVTIHNDMYGKQRMVSGRITA
jgi:release factor glutamine methyltransferase